VASRWRTGRAAPHLSKRILHFLEITLMFKKLIPVVALALIAGPVLAADPPAGGSDQSSSSSSGKTHHKHKHHKSSSKSKTSGNSSSDTSSTPAK
jgi:hypothetical protein